MMSELGKCLKRTGCKYGTFCEMAFSWKWGKEEAGAGCPAQEQEEICSQASGLWKSGKNMRMGDKCKGEREVRVGRGRVQEELTRGSRGNQCGAPGRLTASQQGSPPRRDSACVGRSRVHRGSPQGGAAPSPDPAPHQLWSGSALVASVWDRVPVLSPWEEPCRQTERPTSSESPGCLPGVTMTTCSGHAICTADQWVTGCGTGSPAGTAAAGRS